MKKKFIFALGVVMLVTLSFMCLNINATSTMIGQYDISATADDSVTATLYENNGEYSVVISGNGNMKNFDDNSERPWDEYGSYNKKLTKATIENGVTSIGNKAFYSMYYLQEVEVANTVTIIGEEAFYSSGIKEFLMTDNIVSIGEKAFYMSDLENLRLSSNLKEISRSAFEWCSELANIEIPEGIEKIDAYAFAFCEGNQKLYIPESVKQIGTGVFSSWDKLESVEISNGVTEIGKLAFSHCDKLTKITIPNNVQTIDSNNSMSSIVDNCDNVTAYCKTGSAAEKHFEEFSINYLIDENLPEITNVNISEIDWTNQDVTITIEAKDELSGLSRYAYSFDGGITWQEENYKTYSENIDGIVIKVKDCLYNTAEYEEIINITNIDKIYPEIENVTGNAEKWTNQDVTIIISSTDNLSGFGEDAYSFDGGATWQKENYKTYSENIDGIEIQIKDKAGNITIYEQIINITKIDKEKPIIENVIGNPTAWTNENVTLTIEGTDNLSGVTEYSFDGGITWQEESSKTYEENTAGIVVKIKDAAGNESELSSEINITKIDKEKPIIENVIGNPTVWTNENVTLTIEGNDNLSGITEYSFDGGETWQEASSKTYEENTSEIVVKIKDAAGNEGELIQGISITKIDKEKPVIENVIGNPTAWTNQNVTLVIEGRDNLSGVTGYSFDGGITWQEESSKTYEENTSGIVVKIKDAVGNESEPLEEISITKIRKPETLEITKVPMKMQYEAYEDFDSTEMIITIIYNNGDREVTTDYTIVNEKRLTCLVTKLEIQFNENPEIKVLLEGIEVGHAEVELLPKAAKCTETGLTQGKYCEVCNEVLVEQEVIPALGHNYENGECTQCGEQVNIEVMSEVYKLENLYISKLSLQTTIDQFKANIQSNATEINVYSKEGKLLTANEIIGTGMQLKVTLGGKTETYSLVVTGDINGNGLIDIQDMVKINAHRLNKKPLQGANLLAADVDENQTINMSDLLKINRYRLHKITNL